MNWASGIDWTKALLPDTPVLEILARGTVMYLGLFLLLRFVLKRESGAVSITDLLVVVLIADAAQNAMADNYTSLADGLLLVAVLIGWAWLLDFLSFHVAWVDRLVKPQKLPLVQNGRMRRDNMRRELVTSEELWSELRKQGIDDLDQVRVAYMEPDGRVSMLTHDGDRHDPPEPPRGM